MKRFRLFLSLLLSALLVSSPTTARADHPFATVAVIVFVPITGALAVHAVARYMESTDSVETKETEAQDQSEGGSSSTDEDTGGDTGTEGGGSSEGGDPASLPAKPRIKLTDFAVGGWFKSKQTRSLYTSRIPTDLGTASARGKVRSASGVGVAYSSTEDEGDVMLSRSSLRKVEFTKTRKTVFQLSRKGKSKKELTVPVRLNIKDLIVSTTDVPQTSGVATSKVELLVDGAAVFTLNGSVTQGQQPVFTGDVTPAQGNFEKRADFGSLKNFYRTIRVKVPKGKKTVRVVLEITTTGRGQRSS